MKKWKDISEDVMKVRPDAERARSLLKMIQTRIRALEKLDEKEFSSIVTEGYYEVIKESIVALMHLDGFKTLSHEALVAYLDEFYRDFSEEEIMLIDHLRRMRNDIVYRGLEVRPDFLERNGRRIRNVIKRLASLLEERLGGGK